MDKMKKVFLHKYANSTINYTNADDKELFTSNLKEHPNNEELLHYRDNPIEYALNDYGFRTPDNFDDAEVEGNVFLGCSHTFGIGHYLEKTWSWRLNQKIGGKFWNLSAPGTGIGTAARLLWQFKDKLKVKNIFLYTPFCYRYEIYEAKRGIWICISPANVFHHYVPVSDDVRFMLGQEENMKLNWQTNLAAIKHYAHELGAKLYSVENIDFYTKNKDNFPEIARDMTHPGVSYQDLVYKKFLEAYENDLPLHEEPASSFKPLKTII